MVRVEHVRDLITDALVEGDEREHEQHRSAERQRRITH
jgi:hypothetical protein